MTYNTNELVPSSKIVRNFWFYLSKISNKELDKIWILRNNKLDAVIISQKNYDWFEEYLENNEIKINQKKIKEEMKKSANSWLSDLVI
jgi:PHD/YefM family antitoxin component YafN of YafNO toxin-antitoxin module